MKNIVIVGGGISGLISAIFLKEAFPLSYVTVFNDTDIPIAPNKSGIVLLPVLSRLLLRTSKLYTSFNYNEAQHLVDTIIVNQNNVEYEIGMEEASIIRYCTFQSALYNICISNDIHVLTNTKVESYSPETKSYIVNGCKETYDILVDCSGVKFDEIPEAIRPGQKQYEVPNKPIVDILIDDRKNDTYFNGYISGLNDYKYSNCVSLYILKIMEIIESIVNNNEIEIDHLIRYTENSKKPELSLELDLENIIL